MPRKLRVHKTNKSSRRKVRQIEPRREMDIDKRGWVPDYGSTKPVPRRNSEGQEIHGAPRHPLGPTWPRDSKGQQT